MKYNIELYRTFEGLAEDSCYFVDYNIDNEYAFTRYVPYIDNYETDIDEKLVTRKLKKHYKEDMNLPVINDCSFLLQAIYNEVYASDSGMLFVETDEERENFVYGREDLVESIEDLEILEKEIEKYHLENIVELYYTNEFVYKITAYEYILETFKWDLKHAERICH